MKTYANNIGKLYETEGFGLIESGKMYVSKKGSKLSVKDIYIDANAITPDVLVKYSFKSPDGKEGEETNRYTVFVDMIRNS